MFTAASTFRQNSPDPVGGRIDRQAPPVAVKKAYKELAKLHHPDRETGNLEPSCPAPQP